MDVNDSGKRKERTLESTCHVQKQTKTQDSSSSSSSNDHQEIVFPPGPIKIKKEYRDRLLGSLLCVRYLLHEELVIGGHGESEESSKTANFMQLFEWVTERNKDVEKIALKNAPECNQLTALYINPDLINICSKETVEAIVRDLDEDLFAILVDDFSDISHKEQMALYLRYVDREGEVVERFLGVMDVVGTTALQLRDAIHSFLAEHSLSSCNIRGQNYDGISNMRGDINGLKTLIMKETQSAYYTHCFAHELEPTLVVVSKENVDFCWFFDILTKLLNMVRDSSKRKQMLKENQAQESEKCFYQELSLGWPSDTCWGFHYKLILDVITLYSGIREVLDVIGDTSSSADDRVPADNVGYAVKSFEFVFMAHLMMTIFGITNELNLALQRKDQDIVNVMSLVNVIKQRLKTTRDDGWETLLNSVVSFCGKNGIEVPNMEDVYVPRGRKKRGRRHTTNLHHFRVKLFLTIIDLQLEELNNRFDEVSMELLICMASLSPIDAFCSFDKQKLLTLAKFYPNEFSSDDLMIRLDNQLDNYVYYMRIDERFMGLKDLGELSKKFVKVKLHEVFDLVYLLIKLVLILPVATASVERAFSAMNFVKNKLPLMISDHVISDCLVTYLEKDVFSNISNDDILNHY